MSYAELVEAGLPLLEFGAIRTTEPDVVEPDAGLIETLADRRTIVEVDAEYRPVAEYPHQVMEACVGVLVEQRLGAEQGAIPRAADVEVAHGHSDVVKCRNGRHGVLIG